MSISSDGQYLAAGGTEKRVRFLSLLYFGPIVLDRFKSTVVTFFFAGNRYVFMIIAVMHYIWNQEMIYIKMIFHL